MKKKYRKRRFVSIIVIFILCMSASMWISVHNLKGILRDSYENDSRVVAALVCNAIENNFLRPITVSETISKDSNTKELLDKSSKSAAIKAEAEAAKHLESIRDGFGYSMVFAVSDLSKAYYTCNGISKFVDPENDEHDIWYKLFVDSGKKYDLDVDTDEAANWSLSVFVNTAVYGEDNEFVGVCGVGVDMTELQNLLERYERIYDVKINLVDETGLIQVDTDIAKIEKDYISIDNLEEFSDGEVYYEILDDGNRIITYMEHLGWYLVIQNEKVLNKDIYKIIVPCVACLLAGIALLGIILIYEQRLKIDDSDAKEKD